MAVVFFMESSAKLAFTFSNAVKVTQIGFWLMSIVFVADCLQNGTSRQIDSMSYKMEKLKVSGRFYSNLDYERMVKMNSLTAWGMYTLRRNLLLTFSASLITFSVIIADHVR
ncbi:hypothetical protein CDAR_537161 [Caerostris darwini]|uniref:Gustatory receptor n=1 Tax=Caerostris darwini TaxID=1538125 RepID=A0AAV4TYF6_9ARAC|nr:hypothetical protein CDAR_537161 [Caerostris darwini]